MQELSPFKLIDCKRQKSKKQYQIYCVKFCPFSDHLIFAAAILNKVEIYKINDDESVTKIRTFEAKRDEYFYALDWSFDKKTNEIVLIGGGMKGRIYNLLETSIFGVEIREPHAINEIVFSPKIEYLFAAAYEDGSVGIYNLKSEICLAICQTQRANSMKQCISVSFDPSGNYLAYGGMTREIFIVNLKDCKDFQDNLKRSLNVKKKVVPVNLNLLHNMCVIQNLHTNFIDSITWFSESSLVTKSADGDIILWEIKGMDNQNIRFKNAKALKLVEQHATTIENCNLWFIRFSLDPLLQYLTIGTCDGELFLWDLLNDKNFDSECCVLKHLFSDATIRQTSFSNNGNYLVCCTDDGFLVSYKKSDTFDDRLVKQGSNKRIRKSKTISP